MDIFPHRFRGVFKFLYVFSDCFRGFGMAGVFRGHYNSQDDVSNNPQTAKKNTQHKYQPDNHRINAEILSKPAANTDDHAFFVTAVKSLFHFPLLFLL